MRLSYCALGALFVLACTAACGDDDGASSPGASDAGTKVGEGSGGCGKAGAAVGALAGQKLGDRSYELFVPEPYDAAKPLPLVFVFHGSGGTGAQIRRSFALEAAAAGGAVFVYPDGLGKEWDLERAGSANQDMVLFDGLVDALSSTYCIDRSRVFATGYSNGAYFANQLGCRRGATLRAIASHAGGGPFGANQDYDENGNLVCPEKPVAALVVHGTADNTVSLDEGKQSRDHWRRVNGCKTGASPYAPDPCVASPGCAEGRPVVYCEVADLGHQVWPAHGAEVTWSFFSSL